MDLCETRSHTPGTYVVKVIFNGFIQLIRCGNIGALFRIAKASLNASISGRSSHGESVWDAFSSVVARS
eukprot:scaffold4740_cov165-Amphora_coffeaeformis.AAC.19